MRKITAWVLAAVMVLSLAACGQTPAREENANPGGADTAAQTSETTASAGDDDSIQIVTTIFPEYDWVMNILGENPGGASVRMLLDNGVDLHSFQPTAKDILDISTCDLFIYVGGESDSWVDDALQESVNPDMVVISLLDVLGDSVKEEEIVEGMQEEEHDHDHDGDDHADEEHADEDHADEDHADEDHEHDHGDEPEYDEHVWLSLRNSAAAVEAITEALCRLDADHADTYRANAAAYTAKLTELDSQYEEAVKAAAVKTLLFGDRFPFRYMTDDYGLDYYAAFAGCSAETEASFETVTFLAGKVDELSLSAVLSIEGSDQKIAQTIVQNTKSKDQKILVLDSMQSVTAKDVQSGTTYLSVMEKNLDVLREALQ